MDVSSDAVAGPSTGGGVQGVGPSSARDAELAPTEEVAERVTNACEDEGMSGSETESDSAPAGLAAAAAPSYKTKPRRKATQRPVGSDQKRQAFSKRKRGLVLKSYQLYKLTDAKVFMFVVNDKGSSWSYASPGFACTLQPQHLKQMRQFAKLGTVKAGTEVMSHPKTDRDDQKVDDRHLHVRTECEDMDDDQHQQQSQNHHQHNHHSNSLHAPHHSHNVGQQQQQLQFAGVLAGESGVAMDIKAEPTSPSDVALVAGARVTTEMLLLQARRERMEKAEQAARVRRQDADRRAQQGGQQQQQQDWQQQDRSQQQQQQQQAGQGPPPRRELPGEMGPPTVSLLTALGARALNSHMLMQQQQQSSPQLMPPPPRPLHVSAASGSGSGGMLSPLSFVRSCNGGPPLALPAPAVPGGFNKGKARLGCGQDRFDRLEVCAVRDELRDTDHPSSSNMEMDLTPSGQTLKAHVMSLVRAATGNQLDHELRDGEQGPNGIKKLELTPATQRLKDRISGMVRAAKANHHLASLLGPGQERMRESSSPLSSISPRGPDRQQISSASEALTISLANLQQQQLQQQQQQHQQQQQQLSLLHHRAAILPPPPSADVQLLSGVRAESTCRVMHLQDGRQVVQMPDGGMFQIIADRPSPQMRSDLDMPPPPPASIKGSSSSSGPSFFNHHQQHQQQNSNSPRMQQLQNSNSPRMQQLQQLAQILPPGALDGLEQHINNILQNVNHHMGHHQHSQNSPSPRDDRRATPPQYLLLPSGGGGGWQSGSARTGGEGGSNMR